MATARSFTSSLRVALSLVAAFAVVEASAASRESANLDVVAIGMMPFSDYKETVSPALGAIAGLELPIFSPISLTARSGYIAHFKRKNSWRSLVPAFGGVKLNSYATTMYLAGEAGPVLTRDNYTGDDPARSSASSTPIAWGVGIGSAVDEHDLRFSLHVWDSKHPGESITFGISLAILFFGG
jgi:hypothetical protein